MNEKKEQTEETNLLKLEIAEPLPTDYMITIHIQNLFATYGEDRVRHSMKTLFNMDSKKKAS